MLGEGCVQGVAGGGLGGEGCAPVAMGVADGPGLGAGVGEVLAGGGEIGAQFGVLAGGAQQGLGCGAFAGGALEVLEDAALRVVAESKREGGCCHSVGRGGGRGAAAWS